MIDDVGFSILLLVDDFNTSFGLLYLEFFLLLLFLLFLFSMGRSLRNHHILAMPNTLIPGLLRGLRRSGLEDIDVLKCFLKS